LEPLFLLVYGKMCTFASSNKNGRPMAGEKTLFFAGSEIIPR
jgi:hypothetical protein